MLWFDPGFREDLDFEGEFGRDIGGEGVLDVPVDVGVIGEVSLDGAGELGPGEGRNGKEVGDG